MRECKWLDDKKCAGYVGEDGEKCICLVDGYCNQSIGCILCSDINKCNNVIRREYERELIKSVINGETQDFSIDIFYN